MCIAPMVLWWIMTFLCQSKKTENQKQRNSYGIWDLQKWNKMKNFKMIFKKHVQTADNISQICCPHVELIPCVFKLWEEHTKTCKIQWKWHCSRLKNNELELRSGEPQASTPSIYIYICVCVWVWVLIYIERERFPVGQGLVGRVSYVLFISPHIPATGELLFTRLALPFKSGQDVLPSLPSLKLGAMINQQPTFHILSWSVSHISCF